MHRLTCVLIAFLGVTSDANSPLPEGGRYRDDIIESPFRLATNRQDRLWSNGVVPYVLDDGFTDHDAGQIEKQMRILEDNTKHGDTYCVRFVPKTDHHSDYVNISNKYASCSSHVGRQGRGAQLLSLGRGCIPQAVIHELMHALGFWHEQSRPDRDDYVKILYGNILSGAEYNFDKRTSDVTTLNTSYDFDSIMHYDSYQWSKWGPTIVPLNHHIYIGGIWRELEQPMSITDVTRVQRLYTCREDLTSFRKLNAIDAPVFCDFETDICNLIQSTDDGFDWVRKRQCISCSLNGTVGDHTYGDGYYLQAITDNHQHQTATILSPVIEPGQYCIIYANFGYAEVGEGTLSMYTVTPDRARPRLRRSKQAFRDINTKWQTVRTWADMTTTWYVNITMDVRYISSGGTILIDDFVVYKQSDYNRCF